MPNYPHHVTQRGTNKTDIFMCDKERLYFLQSLKDYAHKAEVRIWAYCLMNNHFHLLLVPPKDHSLGRCIHGATFRYAQYFNRKYKRTGRLWQNRYFPCVVDKDGYLWSVVRYIERNPVRANITEKAEDWKWSSVRAHMYGEKDYILSVNDWLDDTEVSSYRDFIKNTGREEEIRKVTSSGRPFGDVAFIENLEYVLRRRLKPGKGGRPRENKIIWGLFLSFMCNRK